MNPIEDGTKHRNVSYNSKTLLGRILSPPHPASFTLSGQGEFESVGGYWLWFLSGQDEKYREFVGEDCFVEQSPRLDSSKPFQKKILRATWIKIRQNNRIFSRFEQNILPFRRYYVGGDGHVYKPSDSGWFTDGLEKMLEYTDKNFW